MPLSPGSSSASLARIGTANAMVDKDPALAIAELLREDKRYVFEAYLFVFDALEYAHRVLSTGIEKPAAGETSSEEEEEARQHHLTGGELCHAIRRFALEQFGYMSKCVLNSWGVYSTSDFGEIVYNLIRIEQMRKTDEDRREDFDNVFDFETELKRNFEISVSN